MTESSKIWESINAQSKMVHLPVTAIQGKCGWWVGARAPAEPARKFRDHNLTETPHSLPWGKYLKFDTNFTYTQTLNKIHLKFSDRIHHP